MTTEFDSPADAGQSGVPAGYQPAYLWAAVAAAAVFALYALTLAPTTQFWDTSEYIATSHILGIPHQPGNPLFVLLGRTWDVLLAPLGLSVAVRINLFSAFMSAAAHGFWFLVLQRVFATFSEDRRFQLLAAAAAVLVSATAFTVWNQSNVNEKVYTVSLLTIAVISWLTFYWRDNLDTGKDDNLLILIVFLLALSVGNHLMAFLAVPAVLAFVAFVRPGVFLDWRLYAAGAVALVAGLSVHLFLPIRAALGPVINEADPTCTSLGGALVSIVTWGQAGCVELSDALSRRQYDKPPLFPRLAPIQSQIANYLQYFDWQWARSLDGTQTVFAKARLPFTTLFGLLGVIGANEHYRRDRTSWIYIATLFITLSAGLIVYLNFRYGYSLPAPIADRNLHEVRERDYFFIASFSVWGLWAGVGIAWVWGQVAARLGSLARAAPVLGLACLPLVLNASWAPRSHDWAARDWAYNLLMSVEPYGILFTVGDNDTFPLWYIQEVEGIRQDVTVIVTSYLNTAWYAKQLRDLTRPCEEPGAAARTPTLIVCQRPYAPPEDQPRSIMLDGEVRPPSRSILQLDDELIDEVSMTRQVISRPTSYGVGRIQPVLSPGTDLLPWSQFALAMIQASIDERPIYFASSGSAPTSLGLDPYLVRHGLAYKLFNGDLATEAPPGTVRLTNEDLVPVTGAWVEVDRTEYLLEQVFVHRTGLPDWSHWPDRSTIGIPNYYAWAYYALAQAAVEGGDRERMEEFVGLAESWALLGTG